MKGTVRNCFQNMLLCIIGLWVLVCSFTTMCFLHSNHSTTRTISDADSEVAGPQGWCFPNTETVWSRNVTSQVWMTTDVTTDMFVYSAYYDVDNSNDEPLVRVIGVGMTSVHHHVICVVQWTADSTCLEIIYATVENLPEHKHKRYSALFIICKLSESARINPYAVSVTGDNSTQLTNRLLVKYRETFLYNLTVCLSCIHSQYDDVTEFIQMMELDQILGVEHFVVYNLSIGTNVRHVLNYYANLSLVDVHSWELPVVEIHYFGQMAAINDCVYSNRGKSRYVIVKDLDEFMVPYKHKTLPHLINAMMSDKPLASTILLRHSFFHVSWSDDVKKFKDSQRAKKLQLYTLSKVWRENFIYRPKQRMKYIVLPNRVLICGIHFVWEFRKGFAETTVNSDQGLLHHYRKGAWVDKAKGKRKEDFLRRFSSLLLNRFSRTINLVHKVQ